jgi:hypothetical protein
MVTAHHFTCRIRKTHDWCCQDEMTNTPWDILVLLRIEYHCYVFEVEVDDWIASSLRSMPTPEISRKIPLHDMAHVAYLSKTRSHDGVHKFEMDAIG